MNKEIIVKMKFGSHLYGTNTEKSDLDYKGIYLPDARDILLCRVKNSIVLNKKNSTGLKNTNEDIDVEYYSLQYFIKLACEGQTVALDMLHAPSSVIEKSSSIWKYLVDNRASFYTKNLNAFVGYARKQAAKYGIKGSRLSSAKAVIDVLQKYINLGFGGYKMGYLWSELPVDEHSSFLEKGPNGILQYQVCGKILQSSQTINYAQGIVNRYYKDYGVRARLAARNQGIDWKAVSHAMRAAFQVEELLTHNTITFPLPNAEFILAIKQGRLDYLTEVAPVLEEKMELIKKLSDKSDLPNRVDVGVWDDFIVDCYMKYIIKPYGNLS